MTLVKEARDALRAAVGTRGISDGAIHQLLDDLDAKDAEIERLQQLALKNGIDAGDLMRERDEARAELASFRDLHTQNVGWLSDELVMLRADLDAARAEAAATERLMHITADLNLKLRAVAEALVKLRPFLPSTTSLPRGRSAHLDALAAADTALRAVGYPDGKTVTEVEKP